MNQNDYEKYGEKITKIICYGQENINNLKIYEESNIDGLKNSFKTLISYANVDIKEKIDSVISIIDLFFKQGIKIQLKEEEDLFGNKITIKLENLIKSSDEQIDIMSKEIKNNLLSSIMPKKENINQLLQSKNYKDILSDIINDIFINFEQLKQKIESYLNKYNSDSKKIIIETIKELSKDYYSKGTINLAGNYVFFKSYFSEKFDLIIQNLSKEIKYEIIVNSTGSILYNEGFFNYLQSLYSDYHYLYNNINIIVDKYLTKISNIFELIKSSFKDYIDEIIHSIKITISDLMINKRKLSIFNELYEFYRKKREEINKIINDI